jgi:hypothetical protein
MHEDPIEIWMQHQINVEPFCQLSRDMLVLSSIVAYKVGTHGASGQLCQLQNRDTVRDPMTNKIQSLETLM